MRATTAFFLASFLLTSWVSAQQFCGFDDLHLLHAEQEEHCNHRITDQLLEGSLRTGEVLVVPVVVHDLSVAGLPRVGAAERHQDDQ